MLAIIDFWTFASLLFMSSTPTEASDWDVFDVRFSNPQSSLSNEPPPVSSPSSPARKLHKNLNLTEFLRIGSKLSPTNESFIPQQILPFDSEGCDYDRFHNMLNSATLESPGKFPIPKQLLCVFTLTIHANTLTHHRFIRRLLDPDFLFIIAPDSRNPNLTRELNEIWANESSVRILYPTLPVFWSSWSQCFSPWMIVNALAKASVKYDWISVHSGSDVPVRGREVIKNFLKVYKEHVEFFGSTWPRAYRVNRFYMSGSLCASQSQVKNLQETVERLFDLKSFLSAPLRWGPSWSTISGILANKVMRFIWDHPEVVARVMFTVASDEHFLPTMLHHLGFDGIADCGFVRYIEFNGARPWPLTERMIQKARRSFKLFARKMPEGEKGEFLHRWIEELIDREDASGQLPKVLQPIPGACYRVNGTGVS
jgi:hypothetical protein